MARIMIIAGGDWQCPIVKKAKEMGHYVICTNLYENSPAFQFSDVGVVADVLDKERNLEIAREYKPDAILTDQSDIAVPTVAYVAEKLGLRGIGPQVAERFTNKYKMREYAQKAGITVPGYRLCHSVEEAADFLKNYDECIIKPLDSQSSRGIHIVRSREDIELFYPDCVQYSHAEKAVLIEEYVDGVEFTVDGVMLPDRYIVTAISEKDHYAHNPSIAKRLLFSVENEKYDYERIRIENEQLVRGMKLPFGQTHTEYKYKNGKFYLIESAARGGGTKISSDITNIMSGIDSNKLLINMLIGEQPVVRKEASHDYGMLGFFDFKPGVVAKIEGLDEARTMEGVHEIGLDIKPGDALEVAKDDRSRVGYYIIYADTKTELLDRERKLLDTVKVTFM